MKINDEEVNAALDTLKDADSVPYALRHLMRPALEAAFAVRAARKAAKRAKAKQKQTVYHVSLGEIDFNALRRQWSLNPTQAVPEPGKPAAPAWNHKFEVGKAYRTRDGRKAIIGGLGSGTYRVAGHIGGRQHTWTNNGELYYRHENAEDLIAPWEEEK